MFHVSPSSSRYKITQPFDRIERRRENFVFQGALSKFLFFSRANCFSLRIPEGGLCSERQLQGHPTRCRPGNGDQLRSSQAEPGQAIKSAVAYFPPFPVRHPVGWPCNVCFDRRSPFSGRTANVDRPLAPQSLPSGGLAGSGSAAAAATLPSFSRTRVPLSLRKASKLSG